VTTASRVFGRCKWPIAAAIFALATLAATVFLFVALLATFAVWIPVIAIIAALGTRTHIRVLWRAPLPIKKSDLRTGAAT